jgi:hypothetical protein
VEAIFHSDGPPETAPVAHHIKFLADGTYFPATEKTAEDGGASSDGIPFYLTPIQARAIFAGHNVNFNVGKNNYRVDDAGIATFHKYVDTIAQLPAAAPSLSRMFHKFVANLPPISTMVSTVCEYVVVGGAGLVVLISLAMVAIGTRAVIKW